MNNTSAFSDIPLHILRAELHRRQDAADRPPCGSTSRVYAYNTPLHVFALFLILILSTFACSFPLLARRFPSLPVPNRTLFLSRHFGTGVLIATAFVHLLPTAYVNLTDPCLPPFWNETYPPMAGFVAMVSVLTVVGIEMFFASKGAGHSHSVDLNSLRDGDSEARPPIHRISSGRSGSFRQQMFGSQRDAQSGGYEELEVGRSPYSDTPGSVDKPLPPPPPSGDDEDEDEAQLKDDDDDGSDLDLDELEAETDADTFPLNATKQRKRQSSLAGTNGDHPRPKPTSRSVSFATPISSHFPASPTSPTSPLPLHTQEQRLVLQCLLLEAGILFHSVFIGMALSVTTGPAFIVLLIAISFHQTFEGLALGSRIAAIPSFSTSSLKPWVMSAMYGVTTPIGQAIGLAVHTLYDPQSQFGLLMVGIVNGISAGLLLYAGLVQLLAEDFLSDRSYVDLRGWRRVEACGAVVAGCFLMSLVGYVFDISLRPRRGLLTRCIGLLLRACYSLGKQNQLADGCALPS